jgi:hypothetical protein
LPYYPRIQPNSVGREKVYWEKLKLTLKIDNA